jgi:hypothetical protein
MNCENLAKIYVIGTKIVSLSRGGQDRGEKGGQKMGQNFFKSLKTNVEKMSAFRLSTMLMKTNELSQSLHDVYENKGS